MLRLQPSKCIISDNLQARLDSNQQWIPKLCRQATGFQHTDVVSPAGLQITRYASHYSTKTDFVNHELSVAEGQHVIPIMRPPKITGTEPKTHDRATSPKKTLKQKILRVAWTLIALEILVTVAFTAYSILDGLRQLSRLGF